ncbi:MAG: hypothetical protein LBJ92_00285 [Holosporales bacterium]|jgi:hypothetical protein|nr:hypothetical protein [Holosporales bacterium]
MNTKIELVSMLLLMTVTQSSLGSDEAKAIRWRNNPVSMEHAKQREEFSQLSYRDFQWLSSPDFTKFSTEGLIQHYFCDLLLTSKPQADVCRPIIKLLLLYVSELKAEIMSRTDIIPFLPDIPPPYFQMDYSSPIQWPHPSGDSHHSELRELYSQPKCKAYRMLLPPNFKHTTKADLLIYRDSYLAGAKWLQSILDNTKNELKRSWQQGEIESIAQNINLLLLYGSEAHVELEYRLAQCG